MSERTGLNEGVCTTCGGRRSVLHRSTSVNGGYITSACPDCVEVYRAQGRQAALDEVFVVLNRELDRISSMTGGKVADVSGLHKAGELVASLLSKDADEPPCDCGRCDKCFIYRETHQMSEEETKPKKWRANWVPAPAFYALNQACVMINKALDGFGCYLVGSSLERRDYRDVDVRYIMDDAAYARLFRNDQGWTNPLWSFLCVSISHWLSEQTGLRIDFQIQQQTDANKNHPDGKRSPLGVFLDYPGERPSDVADPGASENNGDPR